MCLHLDLDHICARGLCRVRSSTDWEAPVYSFKEEQLQREGRTVFSLVPKHIGSIQQSPQSGLAHNTFLSQCLWETENAPKKQDSGSQQLETDGSHKRLSLSNIPAAGSAEYHSELLCLWSQCLC